jgi:hypothetical protein
MAGHFRQLSFVDFVLIAVDNTEPARAGGATIVYPG